MSPDGDGGVWFGTELGLTHSDAKHSGYDDFGGSSQQATSIRQGLRYAGSNRVAAEPRNVAG